MNRPQNPADLAGYDDPDERDQRSWESLAAAFEADPVTVNAEIYLARWETFSGPAEFRCSDGQRRVLKAVRSDREIGRALFNDHAIGRLGEWLRAPVGQVGFVNISSDLIASSPVIAYMLPGTAHSTERVPDVSERINSLSFCDVPENLPRYSALSVLFGWVGATGDRQFIFGNKPPNLVHSVDHGHFFPGGPNWTQNSLASFRDAPVAAADLVDACGATESDLKPAFQRLRSLTEAAVIQAVMAPPESWGVPLTDRLAIAKYLWRRREEMLSSFEESAGVS